MKNFCLLIEKSLTSNECNAYNVYMNEIIQKEVKSMADTSLRISKELVKKYDKINFGKFSKAKAKFSEFAKTVIEEEIERLSNESAVLKKSA